LIERQRAGDLEGMIALYEENAVLDAGSGTLAVGRAAIRKIFEADLKAGKKYQKGVQREPVISGDLALTSTELPDGTLTAEVAKKQKDGSWLWVIDRFSVE